MNNLLNNNPYVWQFQTTATTLDIWLSKTNSSELRWKSDQPCGGFSNNDILYIGDHYQYTYCDNQVKSFKVEIDNPKRIMNIFF